MLRITTGFTSDYFHTHSHIDLINFINCSDCSKIWNTIVSEVYNCHTLDGEAYEDEWSKEFLYLHWRQPQQVSAITKKSMKRPWWVAPAKNNYWGDRCLGGVLDAGTLWAPRPERAPQWSGFWRGLRELLDQSGFSGTENGTPGRDLRTGFSGTGNGTPGRDLRTGFSGTGNGTPGRDLRTGFSGTGNGTPGRDLRTGFSGTGNGTPGRDLRTGFSGTGNATPGRDLRTGFSGTGNGTPGRDLRTGFSGTGNATPGRDLRTGFSGTGNATPGRDLRTGFSGNGNGTPGRD